MSLSKLNEFMNSILYDDEQKIEKLMKESCIFNKERQQYMWKDSLDGDGLDLNNFRINMEKN